MSNSETFTNLPPVVTIDLLIASHGADGERLYHRISQAGGFGDFSNADFSNADFVGGCPALDISGLGDDAKKAVGELLTSAAPKPPVPLNPNSGTLPKPTDNKEEK